MVMDGDGNQAMTLSGSMASVILTTFFECIYGVRVLVFLPVELLILASRLLARVVEV